MTLARNRGRAGPLSSKSVPHRELGLLVIRRVRVLRARTNGIMLTLSTRYERLGPFSILPMEAQNTSLTGVSLEIGIHHGKVAIVATITVRGVGNVGLVGMILGHVYHGSTHRAQVRTNATGDRGPYLFGLLLVDPLPEVVGVHDGTRFLTTLLMSLAPYEVVYVFELVIYYVSVIRTYVGANVRCHRVLMEGDGVGGDSEVVDLSGDHGLLSVVHVGLYHDCGHLYHEARFFNGDFALQSHTAYGRGLHRSLTILATLYCNGANGTTAASGRWLERWFFSSYSDVSSACFKDVGAPKYELIIWCSSLVPQTFRHTTSGSSVK